MTALSPFPSRRCRPPLVVVFSFPLLLLVVNVAARTLSAEGTAVPSPFTPKAAAIRYWNRRVPFKRRQPAFIVSKLSPLSAVDSAVFSSLAAARPSALSSRLSSLCSAAHLLCLPSLSSTDDPQSPFNYILYDYTNYTNYGTNEVGGNDSFFAYSLDFNMPVDSFKRYSRDSVDHSDIFSGYANDGNAGSENFSSYGASAGNGAGSFMTYSGLANWVDLKFVNYEAAADGRSQDFKGYSQDANIGDESFAGYGKKGNGIVSEFKGYADSTNVISSSFTSYDRQGNVASNSFNGYGSAGNAPDNTFRSYGDGGRAGSEEFTNYSWSTNGGSESFRSYAKNSDAATVGFLSYGSDYSAAGSETFKNYGKGSETHEITFDSYHDKTTTFKGYAKSGIIFQNYENSSSAFDTAAAPMSAARPAVLHRRQVEPGKFFRERELRSGSVMPMPDMRDRMPARSFLPRSIAGQIPFSAAEVRRTFEIPAETALWKAVGDTVGDCERPPSRGETKRCPTSAEDVIDFAVEVLGSDVEARSTESAAGSGGPVTIGEVRGLNGGNVTESVSCHQSLFPYMVYYCHSVPRVRVYEADILSVQTQERINRGVAICHLDTSAWGAGHGAFMALGPGPGKIEVCHWIFEGDMTWTVAD